MASPFEQIKERLKLEDLIGETFTVTGRGHTLTTVEHDSLKIEVNHQRWRWYSSRWQEYGNIDHGDIFDWYQLIHRCDWRQAIEALADKTGVELRKMAPEERAAVEAERAERRRKAEILELATRWFEGQLWGDDDAGRRYVMEARGWTEETLRRERVGYNPTPSPSLTRAGEQFPADKKALSPHLSKILRDAGLMEDPLSRAVLSLPASSIVYAHQERGQIVYLSARSVEGKRHYNLPLEIEVNGVPTATGVEKRPYANSPATSTGSGGRLGARVLVEGQGDAISMSQLGIDGVALCGLAPAEVGSVSHVGLDNDTSGQAKALEMALGIDPLCRVIEWPKQVRHRLGGHNHVMVKDAGDLTKGAVEPADMAVVLENSLTAIERLALVAGRAKDDERKELLRRFFMVLEGLDKVAATDLKPSLAKQLCGGSMAQFNRLLKAHKEEQKSEKESSERVEYSMGGYIGGYLFEQCVQFLPDGRVLTFYWVRTPEGKVERQLTLDIAGVTYVPYSPTIENTISKRVVLFPSDMDGYRSESELFNETRAFIHRWVDVDEFFEQLATYYVFLTWLYDSFHIVPYLRAVGDTGTGKTRLMKTVGVLCYRPMFMDGATSEATFFHMIDMAKGTMILDEADFGNSGFAATITKILNSGNSRYASVLRQFSRPDGSYGTVAYDVYSPKCIAGRALFDDRAVESRCISYQTYPKPLRADIEENFNSRFYEDAQQLRNKFLQYRFANFQPEVEIPRHLSDKSIEPRLNQVSVPLKCIIKDPQLLSQLTEFVRHYNKRLITDRQLSLESVVVQALANIYYGDSGGLFESEQDFTIGNIAKKTAELMASFDPDEKINPRKVGSVLSHGLGLMERKTDRQGSNVLVFDELQLAALMKRYGISRPASTLAIAIENAGHRGTSRQEGGGI